MSSRQKLCINPKVARLGSVQAINDRCAELQKPKASDRCPFMLNAENLAETHQFRDRALATVPDIEDLYVLGKSLQVCPYYASRTAVANAEIVTLPYQLLLQKTARDALGIKLEGNVVIIDEAHNIMDAIAGAYAAEIKLSELRRAREMMAVYAKRFGKKLKGENRVMVGQLGRVVQGLSDWMEGALGLKEGEGIVDSNELLKHRGIDQINLFKLIEYIQESKLAFKIESYAAHAEAQQQDEQAGPASSASKSQGQRRHASQPQSPVLHSLTSFLVSLTNLSTEGRIFYHRMPSTSGTPDIRLSYLLLSPTHAFSPIVEAARAVILAGGTMAPMSDFVTHLFPQVDPTRITTLSCGHVIPKDNLCVWTLASSSPIPAGVAADDKDAFDFSFARRSDRAMIRRLGTALLNVCNVVPDGIVVFFPSYGYLDEVVTSWQSMATDGSTVSASSSASQQQSIYARLNIRKSIFRDARDADGEAVLRDYSAAVLGTVSEGGDALDSGGGAASSSKKNPAPTRGKGALLLSVVGGRMSEGINFSDALGRCVVVVGLPYPNAHSPEWKARAEYVEQSTFERLTNPAKNSNKDASRLDTDPGAPPSSASSETQPHTTAGIAPAQAREASKQAAREFYENACMRAVNQSVGRAVRHKDDYAAIVLVDRRFATPRIRGKLPGWIREGMVAGSETKGVPGLMGSLGAFFRGKRDVAVKLPTR